MARERSRPDPLGSLNIGVAVIAVIAAAFGLWAIRSIVTPLALAIFLLIVIDGAAKYLNRRLRVPTWAALPTAITTVIALFAVSLWLTAENAAKMVGESARFGARLDYLLRLTAAQFGVVDPPTFDQLVRQLNPARFLAVVAGGAGQLLESAFLVLVYLGFMLASRRRFAAKLNELVIESGSQRAAQTLIDRVQSGIAGYVLVQTVVGLILASLSAVLMWATGLPHVLFWAFLIFLATYIPIIGGAVGVFLPPLFGLIELDDPLKPLFLLIGMELIHLAVGNIVTPRLQGARLNIDPIVVVLALVFWGLMWGVAGAFLSTPLTVLIMAVCAEFPATRGLAVLISADGRPFAAAVPTMGESLT